MLGVVFSVGNSEVCGQKNIPIQTDRPDQTETPYTVPKKRFQVETGFLYEHTDGETKTYSIPSVLFKYGLTNTLELGIVTELAAVKTANESITGLNPVTLRFKKNLITEKGLIPMTSLIGYLGLPSFASAGLKATYLAPAIRLTMQHTLSDKLSLGYNLAAEWDGETTAPAFVYTLTTGYAITPRVGSYAELYGFSPYKSKADHRFDCGLNYLLRQNILFDISGGIGLTENAPDYFMALGLSFRLKD